MRAAVSMLMPFSSVVNVRIMGLWRFFIFLMVRLFSYSWGDCLRVNSMTPSAVFFRALIWFSGWMPVGSRAKWMPPCVRAVAFQ